MRGRNERKCDCIGEKGKTVLHEGRKWECMRRGKNKCDEGEKGENVRHEGRY